MRTCDEYIDILKHNAHTLRDDFGVRSLCIFGSVARGEQKEDSDIDVCVDMDAKMFLIIRLKRYLETILGKSVDIVRERKSLNPFLKSEITRDAIYALR